MISNGHLFVSQLATLETESDRQTENGFSKSHLIFTFSIIIRIHASMEAQRRLNRSMRTNPMRHQRVSIGEASTSEHQVDHFRRRPRFFFDLPLQGCDCLFRVDGNGDHAFVDSFDEDLMVWKCKTDHNSA